MPEHLYQYIWRVTAKRQIWIVLITICIFPLSMVPLELQRRIVDEAIRGADLEALILLVSAYVAYIIIHGALKFVRNIQGAKIALEASLNLRKAIYYCIYSVIPPSKWNKETDDAVDDGTVVSMLASEAEKLGQFIGGSFSNPILQGGTIISVLGYMMWVEPTVALIGLAFYAPQMAIIPLMQQRINRHNERYTEEVRSLGDFVVENAKSVKGFKGASDKIPEKFNSILAYMLREKLDAERLKFLMKLFRNAINNLGPASILLVGGWFVINGRTELGTVVAFLSGFERLRDPWNEIISFYREVSNARMKYRMLIDAFPPAKDPQPLNQIDEDNLDEVWAIDER